jgi:hypothetical protein
VGALGEDPNVDAIIAGITPLAPLLRTLPAEMAVRDGEKDRKFAERLSEQRGWISRLWLS